MTMLFCLLSMLFVSCASGVDPKNCALLEEPEISTLNPAERITLSIPGPGELTGSHAFDDPVSQDLHTVFQATYDRSIHEGMQVMVLSPRQGLWEMAEGYTDEQRTKKISQDTQLHYASIGKIFTAAIILKLCQDGILTLDDPVARWFPHKSIPSSMKIDHLLRHTSGLVSNELIPANAINKGEIMSANAIIGTVFSEYPDLLFPPGTAYHYSNTGYILLGLIAERSSGKSMESLFYSIVTTPVGLNHTKYLSEKTANSYDFVSFDQAGTAYHNAEHPERPYGAGSLISTPREAALMLAALLNGKILDAKHTALMITDMNRIAKGEHYQVYYGRGLSCIRITREGYRSDYIGHKGFIPFMLSSLFYCPQKNTIMTLTSNRYIETLDPLMFNLYEKIRNIE